MKNLFLKKIRSLTPALFTIMASASYAQIDISIKPMENPKLSGVGVISKDFKKIQIEIPELKDLNIDLILDMDSIKTLTIPEGPRTGGGGNSCALAIKATTQTLKSLLDENPEKNRNLLKDVVSNRDLKHLKSKIENAKFYVSSKLVLNKERKDAINYPHQNTIVLDSDFCLYKLPANNEQAMALLLHEYLGLAQIDDTKYQISTKFLDNYKEFQRNRNELHYIVYEELEKSARGKKSCFGNLIQTEEQNLVKKFDRYIKNEKGRVDFTYDVITKERILVEGTGRIVPVLYDKKNRVIDPNSNIDLNKYVAAEEIKYDNKYTFLIFVRSSFSTNVFGGDQSLVLKMNLTEHVTDRTHLSNGVAVDYSSQQKYSLSCAEMK